MRSDFTTYYPDNKIPILPFIVSPFFQQQDTLILAPQSITQQHDHFIDELYKRMPSTIAGFLYLRVFSYDARIVIAASFPTRVKEHDTDRTGIALTLGLLIERDLFRQYITPSSSFFSLYISLIRNLLEIDLFREGAGQFVTWVNDESHHARLKDKLSLILEVFFAPASIIRSTSVSRFRYLFRRRKPLPLPRVILCNNTEPETFLHLFLAQVDNHLIGSYAKKVDISNHSFSGGDAISLVKLDYPFIDDLRTVGLVKMGKRKYIMLY